MADVTATFAAKDQGVAAMIQRLENKLAGFQKSMSGVSASATRMQSSFAGLRNSVLGLAGAYLGVSQAISAFNNALDYAGELNDLSQATGVSAGKLALLRRAFQNNGIAAEKVGPMLVKMVKFVRDLRNGAPEAVAAANQLGISFDSLKNKSPEQQMQILLQALARLRGEQAQNEIAAKIFGDRLGYKLIPLAKNFASSIAGARGELGSLVKILDLNGESIDELGDKLKNAVFAKPMEFALGFMTAAAGASKLVDAMAKIDAAGAGLNFGKMFLGSLKAPEQAFVAMGETLLVGVMKAGNMLIDAVVHAGTVWQKYLTDSTVQRNLFSGLFSGFQMIFNWGNKLFYSTFKTVVQLLDKITLGNWPYAKETIAAIENLQKQFDNQTASIQKDMKDSLGLSGRNFIDIAKSTSKQQLNTFDVDQQKREAQNAWAAVGSLGEAASAAKEGGKSVSDYFAELNAIYKKERAYIEAMDISQEEKSARIDKLGKQWNQARNKVFAPGFVPPTRQMQDAAMTPAARDAAATSSGGKAAIESDKEVASETTLQKVEKWLAELNTKLPQPVLV